MTKHPVARISDTLSTFGHLGVMVLAFGLVVLAFMWKEGRLTRQSTSISSVTLPASPEASLTHVPDADVGIRMIFDQANGEMSTGSARIATSSAIPTDVTEPAETLEDIPKLDLTGPWQCAVSEAAGEYASLSIANSRMRLEYSGVSSTQNMLFDGDCMYTWESTSGSKQCGMSQYLTILQSLMGTEGLDVAQLLLADGFDTSNGQDSKMLSLLRSCQQSAVNESVFRPPLGVNFTQIPIDGAPDMVDLR